jgi:hypothetical protein
MTAPDALYVSQYPSKRALYARLMATNYDRWRELLASFECQFPYSTYSRRPRGWYLPDSQHHELEDWATRAGIDQCYWTDGRCWGPVAEGVAS